MTLATASETNSRAPARLARAANLTLGIETLTLAATIALCCAFFTAGGLEVLLIGAGGALFGARNADRDRRLESFFSGAFAGLFVGAFFAAFFHDGLAFAMKTLALTIS